ncbi:MAG: ThiF family adenylyltransferase [Romboutsia sp.]|nr:ThiF family adenylyltransferase [Romboutsia sp.]
MVQNDYSRQSEIFNVNEWNNMNERINVIGCGATGSWVALSLAKLGIENVYLYDFDKVEMHNLPNQAFGVSDIGQNKAEAIKNTIKNLTGLEYKAFDKQVNRNDKLPGITFLLVDSMKAREGIMQSLKFNPQSKYAIETRLALEGGILHFVDCNNLEKIKNFEDTLFSDSEAQVSACGHSLSLGCTSQIVANMAVMQIIKLQNKQDIPFKTLMDFTTNTLFEM